MSPVSDCSATCSRSAAARGSRRGSTWRTIPLHPGVVDLARSGCVTGASGRNWAGYGSQVSLAPGVGDAERAILTDPQTSGGLLVACAPEATDVVLAAFSDDGFTAAAVIGEFAAGPPGVIVR